MPKMAILIAKKWQPLATLAGSRIKLKNKIEAGNGKIQISQQKCKKIQESCYFDFEESFKI